MPTYNVGMQPEVDPRFTLAVEISLLTLGLKEIWLRDLDRKVDIRAPVENPIHQPFSRGGDGETPGRCGTISGGSPR